MHSIVKTQLAVLSSLILGGLAPVLAFESHFLHSGNGLAGGPDSQVTYLQGPLDSEFGVALTAADFAAAQAGPPATILSTLNGAWTPTLITDPTALWISDNIWGYADGSTNLYAIPFTIDAPCISAAYLNFNFLSDNWLGEIYAGVNQGLYINGVSIPATTGGNYATETNWPAIDISALVLPGLNTLYILSSDVGGPGGLNFNALLRIEDCGTVGAEDQAQAFQLGDAWPNPFNPVTTLSFTMAETGMASMTVYNLAGAQVATLWDGLAERGLHEVIFDAAALPSGIYLYSLSTEQGVETRKMILSK